MFRINRSKRSHKAHWMLCKIVLMACLYYDLKILTCFCISSLQGHRPPIRSLQPSPSWASLPSCIQVWPIFLPSVSRSRRQVIRGLPLFLFPWGFHLRTSLVVLVAVLRSVWPIHPHRFQISTSADFLLVRWHNSSLPIVSME